MRLSSPDVLSSTDSSDCFDLATGIEARVLIAGDVCPVAVGTKSLLDCLGISQAPDLMIFTLDAAVAVGPPERDTCIAFRPDDLAGLRLGRTTNLAVTASNHLTDFGDAGVRATLEALDKGGFEHVGAGMEVSASESVKVVDLPSGGGRIALLAFAETGPRVGARAAGSSKAGVRAYDEACCLYAIEQARREADWVWVILHWGQEFVRYPDPEQRRMAWRMADAGAALVVASHTHVPLGHERRSDTSIFYGLGNFMFPAYREGQGYEYRWHPLARRGIVLQGCLVGGRWRWTPLSIRHNTYGLPSRTARDWCPNYATALPVGLDAYDRLYRRLRRRERLIYVIQRLMFMTTEERAFRTRKLLTSTRLRPGQ